MSVAVMAWAWKLRLGSPTRKVVLLKLADNANDSGQCFPSIPYIAHQCEIDERTVQRTIQALVRDGYLHVEHRSHNGHPTSNVYHLHCPQVGGGRLSPPPGTAPPPLPAPGRDGGGPMPPVTTTTKPKEEPSSQRGHRVSDSLALPAGIPSAHRLKAHALLSSLPTAQQQRVADEWAARLRRGSMHKPLAYLSSLIKRAAAGTFVPELADEERLRREAQQGGAIQVATTPLPSERAAQVQQLVADAVAHLRRN